MRTHDDPRRCPYRTVLDGWHQQCCRDTGHTGPHQPIPSFALEVEVTPMSTRVQSLGVVRWF